MFVRSRSVRFLTQRFVLALALLAGQIRSSAGPLEALSSAAYVISGGESCADIDEEQAANTLSAIEANCSHEYSGVGQLAENLNDIEEAVLGSSEDRFFAALARQHSAELQCSSDFANQVGQGEAATLDYITAQFRALRKHKQDLIKDTVALSQDFNVMTKLCPTSIEEVKPDPNMVAVAGRDAGYEYCNRIVRNRSAVNAIIASIPLSGVPGIFNLIDRYATDPEAESEIGASLANEIKKAYRDAAGVLKQESDRLKNDVRTGGGAALNRATRSALLSDPAVTELVRESGGNREVMDALACRADARYGSGADALDTGLLIGSFALSAGAGVAVKAGTTAARVASVANSGRSLGLFSLNSARALQFGALAMDSMAAVNAIDQECMGGAVPTLTGLGASGAGGQCVSAPKTGQVQKDACVLTVTLSAMGFGAALLPDLARIARRAPNSTSAAATATANTYTRAEIEGALGRPVSQPQMDAIDAAHDVGAGEIGRNGNLAGVGNYTTAQLREKAEILRAAGFSREDIRKLMEEEFVGYTAQDARRAFADRYLRPDQATQDRQRAFREAWARGDLNSLPADRRVLAVPIDGQPTAARLLRDNADGTLLVETFDGEQRIVSVQDLASVRFASEDSAARFTRGRLAAVMDPARAPDERVAQFRRSWASGDLRTRLSGDTIISFKPDGGINNYAAQVVEVTADGRVRVQMLDGTSRFLTEAELASTKFSSSETAQEFVRQRTALGARQPVSVAAQSTVDPVSSTFRGQPGFTVAPTDTAISPRPFQSRDGNTYRFNVVSAPAFRARAERAGLISEFSSPGTARLPEGSYTYLITRDGQLVTGRVSNNFELGVKHQNLANGREVVVAGELRVAADGTYTFNIESGTYTRQIVEDLGVSSATLEERAARALRYYTGSPGRSTDTQLMPRAPPSLDEIRGACQIPEFLMFNQDSCCFTVRIGCR